jgi:glycosyltransferase involved in cell wall biosynthesis
MQQERAEKIPVLIASGLKPVQDIRAFGKLGLSMSETNKYSLNFIGFCPKRSPKSDEFRYFYSITDTKSLWQRAWMPFRFAQIIKKVRPKIVICCTWEFLPVARLLMRIYGFKLIYDVQENYIANLNLNPERGAISRFLAKSLIRLSESKNGIDHFLLAEKCYENEMPEKSPALVLPNLYAGKKTQTQSVFLDPDTPLQLLITGTLSPSFGTENALLWFLKLSDIFPKITLRIVGHCPIKSFQKRLEKLAENQPNISLLISENPMPHKEIIEEMKAVDLLLLPYEDRDEFRSKMPTKLFECAALNIPILHSPNPLWEEFLCSFNGGKSVNFLDLDQVETQFKSALQEPFYSQNPPLEIYWDTVKNSFLEIL